jgi:hypothetical protein
LPILDGAAKWLIEYFEQNGWCVVIFRQGRKRGTNPTP